MRDVLTILAALLCAVLSARLTDRYLSAVQAGGSPLQRDVCPLCGREREVWDKIPLLSWMLTGGRCRFCSGALSRREPILSGLSILLWVVCLQLWLPCGPTAAAAAMLHGACLLCAAGLIWVRAGERPVLLLPLLLTGIVGVFANSTVSVAEHLLGCGGTAAFALLLRLLSPKHGGARRLRRDTAAYLSCTGLLLGWRSSFAILPGAVFTAFILLLIGRRKVKSAERGTPEEKSGGKDREALFDPSVFLIGGAVLALLFGSQLMDRYVRLFIH